MGGCLTCLDLRAIGPGRFWPAGKAAANHDVIAFNCIAFVIDGNSGAHKADIANIMLRTGMMTAGDMDVDRLIKGDALIKRCGEGERCLP